MCVICLQYVDLIEFHNSLPSQPELYVPQRQHILHWNFIIYKIRNQATIATKKRFATAKLVFYG